MSKYSIPSDVIEKFSQVACHNRCSRTGNHIETLAYLVGHRNDNTLIATDLVFPTQVGTTTKVDDEGKIKQFNL